MSKQVLLFESVSSAPSRVDREKSTIYGVKILGRFSNNTHGEKGVTRGTEYTREAMQGALSLYESQMVNVDHPPRDKPHIDRSSLDRSGKLFSVRLEWGNADPEKDGIYGDLKLIPSHPMTPRLLDCASDPDLNDCFGLSHNAWGSGNVIEGRYVIDSIPKVRSVDVVADAGTVRSLFESRENQPVKKKLKEVLEASKAEVKKKFARILQEAEYCDMESEDAGGEGSVEDHLCNAINAVVRGEGDLSSKKKQIVKLLKMLDGDGETSEVEESEENDAPPKKDEKEGDKDKEVKESKEQLQAENKALRICMEAGITKPAASLIKAMKHLTESEMKELAEAQKPVAGQKPRTQPAGTPVLESRTSATPTIPTDPKKTAAWLRN